ncbi:aldo/keto reductase [Lactobacillus sp. CC-MHH1034]|nr:aldo/keto reductase [Agrilactobacillus fermenti]
MPQMGLGVWQVDNHTAKASVQMAVKNGYRMIDTAKQYGNETGVGAGIKASLVDNGLHRDDLFVTTKVFNGDQGYQTTIAGVKGSLQRLQLDYVDLLLIHWPVDHKYKDTWRALEALQKEGLTKSIGISNFDIPRLQDLLTDATIKPAINQMEFNPIDQQKELRQFMQTHDIRLEAWSPLGGGAALNNAEILKLADKYGKSAAQIILRWDIQHDVITIPKSSHEKRIIENSQIGDFELSSEDMQIIDDLDQAKASLWYDDFPWHNPQSKMGDSVKVWPDSPEKI